MSVIEVARPTPPAPTPPAPSGGLLTALRAILLVILAASALIALPSARPGSRSPAAFLDDLRSGSVSSVRYAEQSNDVRWSTGWLQWSKASLAEPLPALPRSPDGFQVDGGGSQDQASEAWISKALDATGHRRIDYEVIDNQDRMAWVSQLPWHGLSAAAGGAALAGFLMMLINGGGRFGNRWAWFWVMLLTSGLGVVLFLLLEPSPVWQRGHRQRALPARPAFLGGVGLLFALALKPALALLALLVNAD